MLHERGIRPGDVIGLSLDQSPLHCVAMLALARLGAVSIPVHPLFPQALKVRLVAKYGIRAIVSHKDDYRINGTTFIKLDTLSAEIDGTDMGFTDYLPDAETPFRISLSSGTTGEPKGVLFTHGYLLDRVEKTLYECGSSSRVIPFDLNFALGLVFAIGVLTTGGTVVFPRAYKPQGLIEAINLYAVTHVSLPPVMLMRMNEMLLGEGIAFPTLKHLRIVGDTPPKALLEALRTKFSAHVFVPYGLTELGAISIATPEILATWPDSSGKVQPWAKAEIFDDATGKVLSPVESGEIRVAMDGMPAGYFKDEGQSRLKFRDGWFYTGDYGRISEEGLLFIEGRMDDIINLDGHKVSPNYIETILRLHPNVSDAVVFAREEKSGAQSLVAAVIPRADGIRQTDLAEYARQQLGPFYPKQFFVMQDFPRNPNGKVLRGEVSLAILKMQ